MRDLRECSGGRNQKKNQAGLSVGHTHPQSDQFQRSHSATVLAGQRRNLNLRAEASRAMDFRNETKLAPPFPAVATSEPRNLGSANRCQTSARFVLSGMRPVRIRNQGIPTPLDIWNYRVTHVSPRKI